MIYVDELTPCVKSKRWPHDHSCHLFADSLDELHAFAKSLGLQRSWFQSHQKLDHYDLTLGKRKQAIAAGAIVVTKAFTVAMFKKEA